MQQKKMTLSEQQRSFSKDVAALINYIYSHNYSCSFGECYRSPELAALYAARGIGVKDSLHIDRLAVDLNLFAPDGTYLKDSHDYRTFGEYWETLSPSNRWGGFFVEKYKGKIVDGNHFERKKG